MIKAYFDRSPDTIEGKFSIKDGQRYLFEKMPARSGQKGFTVTDWTRGKSPIPYGLHHLWLEPVPLASAEPRGTDFFYISNGADKRIIKGELGLYRQDVGLHMENKSDGSVGCIVLLVDTPERKAYVKALFAFLRELPGQSIPLEVL